MTKIISLFNHKGGVSKTTTTYNLGWALAGKKKKVLIVDGDPQCNLTGTVLDFEGAADFEDFYKKYPTASFHSALAPAFMGRPEALKPADVRPTQKNGLFILAGHLQLADYEPQLAIALSAGASLPALRNLPGVVSALLRMTAETHKIDIVLVDMSPSIGAFNQSLFLGSDYFIVPTSPDYFCFLAVNSLASILPKWNQSVGFLRGRDPGLAFPLPGRGPRFLGILSQRYRPRSGAPAAAFQAWIDRIKTAVGTSLVPALAKEGMAVSTADFEKSGAPDTPFNLCNIADFNSLIAQSHQHNTPVFALKDSQLERVGVVLETMKQSRDSFRAVFEQLASTVLTLTA